MHYCFQGEFNRHDPTHPLRHLRDMHTVRGADDIRGVSVPKVQLSRVAVVRPGSRAFPFHVPGVSRRSLVMKRFIQISAIMAVIVSLGACAEFPDYKPSPGASLASITLSPEMAKETLNMCKALHDCYELPPSYGVIMVPTNQRISLYRKFSRSANARTKFCSAGISFVPKDDQRYFAAFTIAANRCMLRIYRWSPKDVRRQVFGYPWPATGLDAYATFDPTMGAPLPLYSN